MILADYLMQAFEIRHMQAASVNYRCQIRLAIPSIREIRNIKSAHLMCHLVTLEEHKMC